MTPAVVIIVIAASLTAGLAWLFWRLASPSPALSFSPDWWEHFSAERYVPLCQLLSEEDFLFLRSQPGYRPEMERRLRQRRAAICRSYLAEIRQDFLRLQGVGLALLASGQAEPELQEKLFRQRVRFTRAWYSARLQVELHRFGPARVDFTGLIGALDASANQLRPAFSQAA